MQAPEIDWISVSDRLPSDADDELLLAMPRKDGTFFITTGTYITETGRWFPRAAKHGWIPSHWSPIPMPPKVN
jgi:hypothetical protein